MGDNKYEACIFQGKCHISVSQRVGVVGNKEETSPSGVFQFADTWTNNTPANLSKAQMTLLFNMALDTIVGILFLHHEARDACAY